MKNITFLIIALIVFLVNIPITGHAQIYAEETNSNTDPVYTIAEYMPSFPGGQEELKKYLTINGTYPSDAKEKGLGGRVIVKFIVEKDGSISNAQISKSIYPSLDKEALRLIQNMPKWIPAYNNEQAVRIWFNVPVSFYPRTFDRID